MTIEWPYRLAVAVILVGAVAVAALLTRRHGRPGAGVPRSADGRLIATVLAVGGLAFYGALLAFLVWPPLITWSSMGLPGWVRWTGSVMLAGGVALALWARFLRVRTRREEQLLLGRFGEAYRRQMDRTGRWLPRWTPPSGCEG